MSTVKLLRGQYCQTHTRMYSVTLVLWKHCMNMDTVRRNKVTIFPRDLNEY